MYLNVPEVRAFVAVTRYGTFTAASESLRITQPALTRRIQMIEHALGGPVFERLPSGPRLTDIGRDFLPFAEAALMALEDGMNAAKGSTHEDRGRVSFASLGALCNDRVVSALRQFKESAPDADLSLSFHAATSDDVSEAVRHGDVQWGLRFRPDPSLNSEIIGYETMVIVCSATHPLGEEELVSVSRLDQETWITFPMGTGSSEPDFWSRLSVYGLQGKRVMLTDSTAAQKRLIEADFGIGLIPQGTVEEDLRSGMLRAIELDADPFRVPVCLVSRKSSYTSKVSARLRQHLIDAFEDHA
jgi:DNA-binding transcriptional LysR family regulator